MIAYSWSYQKPRLTAPLLFILFSTIKLVVHVSQVKSIDQEIKDETAVVYVNHDDCKINQQTEGNRRIKRTLSDIGWSIINEEVDIVIAAVLKHLHKINIEHLYLPDINTNISLTPLLILHDVNIYLTKGIAYNLAGIQRYGLAYMTYEKKSFWVRFYLNINQLQFEYNFLLRLIGVEGYGKLIGSLEDTVIYVHLAIDIKTFKMKLYEFRVLHFRNMDVQLDETRLVRNLSRLIIKPLTNNLKQTIINSISNNLIDQLQIIIDDFSIDDPLELHTFVDQVLGGLTGSKHTNQ